jgi:diguanylate cyclase (GGDEF)-like protein
MATPSTDADRAGLQRFALPALLATALGGAIGIVVGLGSALPSTPLGGLLGAFLGFAAVAAFFVATSARHLLELANRVDELETKDRLTGLPNGRALRSWLDQHLSHANDVQSYTALLVIHAEGIRRINETHGREIGDELVKALVARIGSRLRPQDELFRPGGTDIAVACPDVAGTRAAEEFAESLLELAGTPYEVDGELLRVSTCIGLAVAGGRPTSASDILRDAEVATYRASANGSGSLVLFEQALVEYLTPATAEHRLRTALERGDFQVTYLPVFSLSTGELVEVEALLRWMDEERGMVAADEFLSAMEQTGIIVPVGTWVLQEGCRQATYWARTFPSHQPVRVTVNLSRRQLLQADFSETVAAALSDAESDPRRVILEVNERSLADQREDLWGVLRRCKDLGVGISLDDLGAANSSVATLRRFQLDQVKIDHSFVSTVLASAEDAAVVRHLCALCRELGIVTVAKSVQARDQAVRLSELGVQRALGRYFSEPVTPGQIDELIYRDLTRPIPTPLAVPIAALATDALPDTDLPQRTPGENAPENAPDNAPDNAPEALDAPAAEAPPERAQPVVVPDVGTRRRFPRRSSMFTT